MPHCMEPLTETAIRAAIDRICDSHTFRGAPKLSRLLRFLADKTFEPGDVPVGQRLVAEQVLGSGDTADVAARMQVGRLRRHLAAYYAAAGRDDPVRIEVPKRNYRLRIVAGGPGGRVASPRARERATLGVVEFTELGLDPAHRELAAILQRELIVVLGPFQRLAVRGPLPQAILDRPATAGVEFLLAGSVGLDRESMRLSLQLLGGTSGLQCWARAISLPLPSDGGLPQGALAALAAVADELADETGVIACKGMRTSAAKPADELSAYEAVLAYWRFLIAGGPDDLARGRQVTAAVATDLPDSASALAAAAVMQLAEYLSDPRPHLPCPQAPLELLDRAASLAPGDPWVQVHRGFALWIAKQPLGLEAICRSLDGKPGSGSFQGMLGSLLTVTAIDLGRGEALLKEALARAPQPLYWYCHHAALCGFLRGDLEAMQAALARIAVRVDPFSLVLRMVEAAARGDLDAARGLSRTILQVFPAFGEVGEVMMRRLLHDDQVDAIAAAVLPLRLGWFE